MNLHPARQIQSERVGDARRLTRHHRGLAVARLLSGSWREAREGGNPPAHAGGSDISRLVELSKAELTEITPLLCRAGAGALAWWQLRDTALADCRAALELREVYRRHRLSALLHEREIANVFSLLHAEGIEAVLVKGWAIARRYPDRALRPYGDIDLCVRPDQFDRAARVFDRVASIAGPFVDLHRGFARIGQTKIVQSPKSKVRCLSALRSFWSLDSRPGTKDNRDWDELYERSVLVQCPTSKVQSLYDRVAVTDSSRGLSAQRDTPGSDRISVPDPEGVTRDFGPWTLDSAPSVPVRVLGDEDHLRLLCLHLLRSGAHRPPWLCDVALLLEQFQIPNSQFQSPTADVQGPNSKFQSSTDRVAVTESSRGLSAQRDTPGSDSLNVLEPEGVKRDAGHRTLDFGPWTLDSSFDWDICLGRNAIDANWIGVAVGLAHELLGADISKTPFAQTPLPRWLAPAVLQQWGGKRVQSPRSKVQSPSAPTRLWTLDLGLWIDLYRRSDNPIRSTAAVGGRFDERSRLPYRLLESALRVPELPALVRDLVNGQLQSRRRINPQITPITQNRNCESA